MKMIRPKSKPLKFLNKGLIAGLAVATLSFFFPIVPCNKFKTCKIPNPFTGKVIENSQNFYNISTEPLAGFILQTILSTIAVILIFSFFRKKSSKRDIIDLTKTSDNK